MQINCYVYLLCLSFSITFAQNSKKFSVGAIFESGKSDDEIAFRAAIEKSNINERSFEIIPIIKYATTNDNFQLEQIACQLISEGVIAIFGTPSRRSGIIGAICHSVDIPHIIFDYKPELRNYEKEFHTMSVSVHPNDLKLAHGYASVVQSFSWDRFVLIYESEKELINLQDVLQLYGPDNKPIVIRELDDGTDQRPLLKDIREMNIPFIIIHCSCENILAIMQQANELNMLGEYISIFLAPIDMHTIDLEDIKLSKGNITAIRIMDPSEFGVKNIVYEWEQREKRDGKYFKVLPSQIKTSMLLISDAVMVFSKGLASSGVVEELEPPESLDCKGDDKWQFGRQIIDAIKNLEVEGLTGRINFDQYGQRSFFNMQILELTQDGFTEFAVWDPVNNVNEIGGEESLKRRGEKLANKIFIVSSRIGKPFLFNRSEFTNETLSGNDRYEGYSMDLIAAIAKLVGFKFEFELTPDNKYGGYDKDTGKWNGIIRQVMDGKADLGICDLTMTSARREVVDFTPPFMTLGITLMYIKPEQIPTNLFSFVDPLSGEVWLKMCGALVGLILFEYVCARMAPEDWENPHPCKTDTEELENVWTITNSIWLAIGSLMGQGCDLLPKSPSTRIITGLWWFFALMMLNSYTANLAAFLTTSGTVDTVKSVEELAGQNKVKYGVVDGGSTQGFFRESNESIYQKMWSTMETEDPKVFTETNDEGEERVVKGKRKYAFFMESSVLEYKIERNCEVLQVGSWLDYKTYGIAMPFNSPYRKEISEAVLKLGESGELAAIKRKWWKEMHGGGKCSSDGPSDAAGGPTPLALKHVGGVFILLGMGILIGLVIAIVEFFWNLQSVSNDEKITLLDAFKLEAAFILKFWITTKPVRTKSGSLHTSSKLSLGQSESKHSRTGGGSENKEKESVSNISLKVLDKDNNDDKSDKDDKETELKPRKCSVGYRKSNLNV